MTGQIPSFTGNTMTELRLSSNQLTGTMPTSFTSLSVLNMLYLDRNGLHGEIPSSLTDDSLDFIHLEHNHFSGPLPHWNFNITELYLSGNQLSLCENPFQVSATFCDVSMQLVTSCGCNLTHFFGNCAIDSQTPICASPAPNSSPPDTAPQQAPSLNTGCQGSSNPGFECREGVWYADGNYIGSDDATFENPVVIGSDASSIANFSSGVYTFTDTLTVRGNLIVSDNATVTFMKISFIESRKDLNSVSTHFKNGNYQSEIDLKRSFYSVPRISADCLTLNGNFSVVLTSTDLDYANGARVALYRTNCFAGLINRIRVQVPVGECRSINYGGPQVSGGPPYTVTSRFVVSTFNCDQPTLPPHQPALNWLAWLLIAIAIVFIIACIVVLVIVFTKRSRSEESLSSETRSTDIETPTSTQMSIIAIDVSELASEESDNIRPKKTSRDSIDD